MNDQTNKPQSFVGACKAFFGFQPGQQLGQFKAEIDALTYNDKMEIAAGLRNIGLSCADPTPRDGEGRIGPEPMVAAA